MISKRTIAAIRERVDLVDVISRDVRLTPFAVMPYGVRYAGNCPFCRDTNRSFHVNNETRLWRCHSCREAGDVYSYLERADGYTFGDAVRAMASRAGVPIEEEVER